MQITASPPAKSRPAVRAFWCPKLRESLMYFTRGSRSARASIFASDSSLLPSSTTGARFGTEWRQAPRTASVQLVDVAGLVMKRQDNRYELGAVDSATGLRHRAEWPSRSVPAE